MFRDWKFVLANMRPSWSPIPTLKFACAGAATAAHTMSATTGMSRLYMVIPTDDSQEGCGIAARIRPPGS